MTRRRLVTAEEAESCPQQPTRPCGDCPWRRDALVGWLGSMDAEEWIAAAHQEAIVDCHALKAPDDTAWHCAGIAIYRANVGKRPRSPEALILPPDVEAVFAEPTEFLRYHKRSGRRRRRP